jgi:hypothetical protein
MGKFIHSRPENRAIYGADEIGPLSIPLWETAGFSPRSFIYRSMLLVLGMVFVGAVNVFAWSTNVPSLGNNSTTINATVSGSGTWKSVTASARQETQLSTQSVRGIKPDSSTVVNGALAVNVNYTPSGWMPGNDQGTLDSVIDNERGAVQQMTFNNEGDASRWTGLYWQYPANNWAPGNNPGYDLSGAKEVTFWAKGENGGETIDARAGGDQGNSFSKWTGSISLNQAWTKYTIDLYGKDLSNVGWGFGVKILPMKEGAPGNAGEVKVYLDDINYIF